MKKVLVLLLACLAVFPAGCMHKEEPAVTELYFERGHGSAWGNQFYIEVNAEEVVTARYIPAGTAELCTVEHLPITEAQWQAICSLVAQLPLEKARTRFGESHKLDGGEYRKLTLQSGGKETLYQWPVAAAATELENLLEALVTS